MSLSTDRSGPVAEPHLFRFRLQQMFLVVTLICLIFALIAVTEGPWPWVISFGTVMVAGHILGNLIGTRLRDSSADVVRWRSADPHQPADEPHITPLPQLATRQRPANASLAQFGRHVRGLRWYLLAGLLAGLTTSAAVLTVTIGYRIGWAGWTVGSFSGGIFGVWAAFMGVSFTTIARDALRQAGGRDL